MKRFFQIPFHIILLGIYPLINLYAQNVAFLPFAETVRSLIITLITAVCFLVSFRVIVKSWQKAGILCSMLLFLFFSFGQVATPVENWFAQKGIPFTLTLFGWLGLALFIPLPVPVLRARSTERPARFVNWISIAVILFPLYTIVAVNVDRALAASFGNEELSKTRGEVQAEASMMDLPAAENPISTVSFWMLTNAGGHDPAASRYHNDG